MLAVMQHLRNNRAVRLTALAPKHGPLAEQLRNAQIEHVAFSLRNSNGDRLPDDEVANQLRRSLLRLKPDRLHANSLSMSRLLGRLHDRLPKMAISGHIRDIMKLSRRAIQDLNQLDGLVAVSRATRNFHVDQGIDPTLLRVIYNGIDASVFRPRDNRDLRHQLHPRISDDAIVLLNVGQICLRKAQQDLAHTAVRLLPANSRLHVVLAGERHSSKAESIALEKEIVASFEEAGCRRHLHLLGHRTDIENWMQAADLLVHTARQEPLGRVLLESAACGLPVIATDVGGTREIFDGTPGAEVIPADHQKALYSAIEQAVSELDERRQLAQQAAPEIARRFSIQQATDELLNFWS